MPGGRAPTVGQKKARANLSPPTDEDSPVIYDPAFKAGILQKPIAIEGSDRSPAYSSRHQGREL